MFSSGWACGGDRDCATKLNDLMASIKRLGSGYLGCWISGVDVLDFNEGKKGKYAVKTLETASETVLRKGEESLLNIKSRLERKICSPKG